MQQSTDFMEAMERADQRQPGPEPLPHPVEDAGTEGKKFGVRAGAYIIDSIVVYLLSYATIFVAGFLLAFVLTLAGRDFYFSEQSGSCLYYVVGPLKFALYFALFEWLYGASLGKMILRMRVVMHDGEPCTFWAALIRAGLRYIDGLFFAIPAYVSMKPPLYQRIGDKAAKTVVVDSKHPVIRQPRAKAWILVAALLYLVVDSGLSLLLLAPDVQVTGAGLQTGEPAASYRSAVPCLALPRPEGSRQPGSGWTSHVAGAEPERDLPAGAVWLGGLWPGISAAPDGALWSDIRGGGAWRFDGEIWTTRTAAPGVQGRAARRKEV